MEEVVQICKMMQQSAQSIIGYVQSSAEVTKSGNKEAIATLGLFHDLTIGSVEQLQKLTIALCDCYFQVSEKNETEESGK